MNPIIRARVRKCLSAIASEVSHNVDNVNRGGCGVYAVELAKRMKKLGFTDMKLRVYGYPKGDNERLVNITSIEREVFAGNPPPMTFTNGTTMACTFAMFAWNGVPACGTLKATKPQRPTRFGTRIIPVIRVPFRSRP